MINRAHLDKQPIANARKRQKVALFASIFFMLMGLLVLFLAGFLTGFSKVAGGVDQTEMAALISPFGFIVLLVGLLFHWLRRSLKGYIAERVARESVSGETVEVKA